MKSKKLSFLKAMFITCIVMAPTCFVTCVTLFIIVQLNSNGEMLPTYLAVMNFLSYAFLVVSMFFLVFIFITHSKMRETYHKLMMAKATQKNQPEK